MTKIVYFSAPIMPEKAERSGAMYEIKLYLSSGMANERQAIRYSKVIGADVCWIPAGRWRYLVRFTCKDEKERMMIDKIIERTEMAPGIKQ